MKKNIIPCFSLMLAMCLGSVLYADSCESDRCHKHWALPLTLDYNVNYQFYDSCGEKRSLIHEFLGESVTFKDLSLFIKLCDDNHVRLQNINPYPHDRGEGDMGDNPPFGDYASDLYTTLIAPVTVSFTNAQEKEAAVNASLIYRFILDDICCCWWTRDVAVSLGITVPFKNKQHQLSLGFLHNGKLFQQIFSPTQTIRETSIYQFFSDFTDVSDYFTRQILGKKGLTFEPNQRKIGVGDISLFVSAEFLHRCKYLENWQIGMTLVAPSGGKPCGDKIWEIVLGNGGATQFDFFSNWYFTTDALECRCVSFLNPAVRLAVEVSAPFCAYYRIPQTVSAGMVSNTRVQVEDIPGLDAPERFNQFYVDPFNESETDIAWFAGQKTKTRVKFGSQLLVGVSDFIYHPMYDNMRLGLFYDFSFKGRDVLRPKCPGYSTSSSFNTELLEKYTRRKMHRIGWNLTYKFQNYVELTVGSQHIVGGENVARVHDCYATAALVF